jgi:hypothetical protein
MPVFIPRQVSLLVTAKMTATDFSAPKWRATDANPTQFSRSYSSKDELFNATSRPSGLNVSRSSCLGP